MLGRAGPTPGDFLDTNYISMPIAKQGGRRKDRRKERMPKKRRKKHQEKTSRQEAVSGNEKEIGRRKKEGGVSN